MSANKITQEQRMVIRHPVGKHARVLAVAGSGKTSTLAYRIEYLVRELQVNPRRIRVLMFNALARKQFREKIEEIGIPEELRPEIHTFHSFSYMLINEAIASGLRYKMPDFWVEDKEELTRIFLHRAIANLVDKHRIPPDSVDVEEAKEAIGLWKGSLIPPLPTRAGYYGNPYVPLVYEEFERLRGERGGVTFDDFVPLAVDILENDIRICRAWCGQADFVIVDEYQDVNYGQQRLVELLAGTRADVMVVGDDDQTIYEWRGARPNYILGEFEKVFGNKPCIDYTLSRSFRFGPVIAQCAQNLIAFNSNRISKPLVAHFPDKATRLEIYINRSEQAADANKELARQVVAAVKECGDPRKVIVLARTFTQLSGLEAEFLASRIPYRVLGRVPFFERRELTVLLDYVRLATLLDQPCSSDAERLLNNIANTPNRKLSREILSRSIERARLAGETIRGALEQLAESPKSPFSRAQREAIAGLMALLDRIHERVVEETNLMAGELLIWLVDVLDYYRHFDNYYGESEDSEDRKRAITVFCEYALHTGQRVLDFLGHVEKLDPTQGRPEEEQIVMTTVFRTKGLEYDYVVIPNCDEGYMPLLKGRRNLIFDKAGIVKEPQPSEIIENERRLFYVAITRARKGVLISSSGDLVKVSRGMSAASRPSRFLFEIQREPTLALMGALQRLAAGESDARRELYNQVATHGGTRAVVRNLCDVYLPGIGEVKLARQLINVAESRPETSFKYPEWMSIATVAFEPKPSRLEPPWWAYEDDD